MVDMGRASLNSMNYIFLRSVFKDDYPEHIKEELSSWLEYVVHSLNCLNCDDIDMTEYLFSCAYDEINEGEYTENIEDVPAKIEEYCKEYTDLDERHIATLCNFYHDICQSILEKCEREQE